VSKFAANTKVPIERSKAEIESLVEKYGASQFFSGWQKDAALIGFRMHDRFIRFKLPMPTEEEVKRVTDQGVSLSEAIDRKKRQRWRALVLVLKAKLEAVETGISEFEDEFLGNIVVSNGQTMAEWAKPQIGEMYASGNMPPLLPSGKGNY
jgi:hypothetical protein